MSCLNRWSGYPLELEIDSKQDLMLARAETGRGRVSELAGIAIGLTVRKKARLTSTPTRAGAKVASSQSGREEVGGIVLPGSASEGTGPRAGAGGEVTVAGTGVAVGEKPWTVGAK